MTTESDFYEDDEPTEKIRAAWKRGKKGRTGLPRDVNQRAAAIAAQGIGRSESPTIGVNVVADVSSIVVVNSTIAPQGPIRVPLGNQLKVRA